MKRDAILLEHILQNLQSIGEFTQDGKDTFSKDKKTQYAVLRGIEIIGEAVKNLSEKIKDDNPDIPWKKISNMRNLLIHEYFDVDLETVWNVTQIEIPKLKGKVADLIKTHE